MKLQTLAFMALLAFPSAAAADQMRSSWYEMGHTTASGQPYDPDGFTCAHRTFPFGTHLHVTFRGKSAECVVNDRGPFHPNRQLDVSRGVARAIGLIGVGVGAVEVQVLP